MISNKIFLVSMEGRLFFLLLAIGMFTSLSTIAQKNGIANNILKRDTIVIDFLLRHQQFYDISLSDTSSPLRYNMVKHRFFCDKIATIHKKGKSISFYGFGSNSSHTRNYLLIEANNLYKTLGTSSLEDDLPKLYDIFGDLGNAIKAKQKLLCYEFLIRNDAMPILLQCI